MLARQLHSQLGCANSSISPQVHRVRPSDASRMNTIAWAQNSVFPCPASAMGSRTVWMAQMKGLTAEVSTVIYSPIPGRCMSSLPGICWSGRPATQGLFFFASSVGMRVCSTPLPRFTIKWQMTLVSLWAWSLIRQMPWLGHFL